MRKFIPITLDAVLDHSSNIYLYYRYIRELTTTQYYDFNSETKTILVLNYIDNCGANLTACYEKFGVSRQTWYKYCKDYPSLLRIVDTPVVMMPYEVFDSIIDKLDGFSMKSKVALMRIYFYMYFNDTFYHGDFQSPQEQMAIELNTSRAYLNKALKLFIEWGWLNRLGKYKFTGDETFAYKHVVPSSMKCGDIFNDVPKYISLY